MVARAAFGIVVLSVGIVAAVFWLASVQEQSTASQSPAVKAVRPEARAGSLPDVISPIGRQPSFARRASTSPRPIAQTPAGSSPNYAPPAAPSQPSGNPVAPERPSDDVQPPFPAEEIEAGVSEAPQADSTVAPSDNTSALSASGFAGSLGGGGVSGNSSSGQVPVAGGLDAPRVFAPEATGRPADSPGSGSGPLSGTQNSAASLSQSEALEKIFTLMTTYSQQGSSTLETFLGHQDPEVRRNAVEAIKQVRTESSAKALRAAAQQASSEEERDYLLQAADFVELPAYVPRSRRSAN